VFAGGGFGVALPGLVMALGGAFPEACPASGTWSPSFFCLVFLLFDLGLPDSWRILSGFAEPSATIVAGCFNQSTRTETGSFFPGGGILAPAFRIAKFIFFAVSFLTVL
jgi:hypothetical protein